MNALSINIPANFAADCNNTLKRYNAAQTDAETHCDALQVYDNGTWHPVVAFSHGYMGPAADYTVAGVKMFKEV